MQLSTLTAISPVDGRYRSQTLELGNYFSEFALIKYRVLIEIEYFIALANSGVQHINTGLVNSVQDKLKNIYLTFNELDAAQIKEIEKTTNHDVKAVEYFIKNKFDALGLEKYKEFVHFGLTSQDINNTAIPLTVKHAVNTMYMPLLNAVLVKIQKQAIDWKQIPMLAKTHGQPASPTLLGKEWMVFYERLNNQIEQLNAIPTGAKFGGATGNFNAHVVAYPQINWVLFANNFCDALGLKRQQFTTQIEHYDNLAALFDGLKRINTILLDFCKDFWPYISMDYFKQQLKEGEIGSSAMPHKVNPIDFENSEGNLGIANAQLEFFASKLPISRLQRDLTDSTVLRNIGVPMAHTLIALQSTGKGLGKLLLNQEKLHADLEENWMVVAEAIQTVLRREAYPEPYEALKDLTRTHSKINQSSIHSFIDGLKVSEALKEELKKITPWNYLGL